MLHLLATKPPSVGRHNGDVVCWQGREPREKNLVSPLCLLIGFLQVIGLHNIVIGSSPLGGGIKDQTLPLTFLQTRVGYFLYRNFR